MESLFVPYVESLALKQLGFDEPCFGGYDMETLKLWIGYSNDGEQFNRDYYYPAPTFSQAFDFFRKHPDWPIDSWIEPHLSQNPKQYEGFYWRRGEKVSVGVFSTYDKAQLNLLRKLIEIVKTKQ